MYIINICCVKWPNSFLIWVKPRSVFILPLLLTVLKVTILRIISCDGFVFGPNCPRKTMTNENYRHKFNLGRRNKRWQLPTDFWSYLKQPLCSDMEGREIKRREWMRGTAAYKLRNRWIYGLMGFAIGTGALLLYV